MKDESQRAQGETERLLQLMQMSQEEQFAKDKTIMELQEYGSCRASIFLWLSVLRLSVLLVDFSGR